MPRPVLRARHATWLLRGMARLPGTVPYGLGPCAAHVLTCARDVDLCIVAMQTLFGHMGREAAQFRAYVWDDGSLSVGHVRRIRRALPGVRIIARTTADGMIRSQVAGDRLARFCAIHPMFLKLLLPALNPGGERRLILMDSDVVFFRCATEVLRWAQDPADDRVLYNAELDYRASGSRLRGGYIPSRQHEDGRWLTIYDPEELARLRLRLGTDVRLAPDFNAGFLMLPADLATVDRIATLTEAIMDLGYGADSRQAHLLEQFTYSLLIGTFGRPSALPSTYFCYAAARPADLVMRHYIGATSTRISNYVIPALGSVLRTRRVPRRNRSGFQQHRPDLCRRP